MRDGGDADEGGFRRVGVEGRMWEGRSGSGRNAGGKNVDEDGAVVADAAEVAGAGVGAQRPVAGMGGVALRQERRFQDAERRCAFQRRRHEAQVDELPLSVEPDASLPPQGRFAL